MEHFELFKQQVLSELGITITAELPDNFVKHHTSHPQSLQSVKHFLQDKFYSKIIPRKSVMALSGTKKKMLYDLYCNLFSSQLVTDTNPQEMLESISSMFEKNKSKINSKDITNAKNIIDKALNLKENDKMGKIIDSVLGDLKDTLKSKKGLKDSIALLSEKFGNELQASIDSGEMSSSDIERNSSQIYESLQKLTKNPMELLGSLKSESAIDPSANRESRRQMKRQNARQKALEKLQNSKVE